MPDTGCCRTQVLSMLGSVEGQRVVELGAGIGRFTGELAVTAESVLAVDFMEHLIAENREVNQRFQNVRWASEDATQMVLPPDSADVVFSNWLLMYLNDAEVAKLAADCILWVRHPIVPRRRPASPATAMGSAETPCMARCHRNLELFCNIASSNPPECQP